MLFTIGIYVAFVGLLVAAAVIDVRTRTIPNELVAALALLWVAWRAGLALGGTFVGADFVTALLAPDSLRGVSLADGIVGAIVLGGALLLFTAAYEAWAHKRALGGGDIKLLAVIGLFLGLEGGCVCLLAACIVALVLAFAVPRVRRSNTNLAVSKESLVVREFPFGPSIAAGALISLLLI